MAATEMSLRVPVDLVKRTTGLAFDIGGTVVKIVYRSKENLEEAESSTTGADGHLQLVSFTKSKISEAVEYIGKRAKITRNGRGEPPEIFATGIGYTYIGQILSETLNIRLKSISEFDCFVKAFIYLASQLSRKDLLEPLDLEVRREGEAEMMEEMVIYAKKDGRDLTEGFAGLNFNLNGCQQHTRDEIYSPDGPLAKCEDIYPCILAMCGSGIGYMQINADKSFKVLDVNHRGGRALLGMATLLTGCKDFEEILELASRGDLSKVDIHSNDFFMDDWVSDGDEGLYTKLAENKRPMLFYNFGKTVGAKHEEFRPEDLAIAWFNYFVSDLAQYLAHIAHPRGIRRLFFCGSICNSHLVRRIMTKHMARRILFHNSFDLVKAGGTQFDFLKPGPHLGALGALITELEKLTGENNLTHL